MKKSLLMALAIVLMNGHIYAAAVSQQAAQTIAVNFFKLKTAAPAAGLTAGINYTCTESNGDVDFYVFDISPAGGFVIVSADDRSVPVIAYSTEGYFNANASKTGVVDWMKTAAKKIRYAVVNNTAADARIRDQWTAYSQGLNPVSTRSAAVTIGPLLTTTWNQEPYYNSLCPFNTTDNERCVTGCVATAMAQIMKYWNYPAVGVGSYHYSLTTYGTLSADFAVPFDWAGMTASVSSDTSPVDSLMYECGVSVAMSYGDDLQGGSGAFVLQSDIGPGNPCSQNSYISYFKYNPNTIQGVYMTSYTTAQWISLMENELNAGRVIQYEGDDPSAGGHTWVCDGYDAADYLHMNWGWGGADDGFYSVGDLDAGGYTFSENDAALIGIEPIYPVSLALTSASTFVCPGDSTTISAHGPASATYTWTPSTGLSCTGCASPSVSPAASTLYTVTVDSSGVTTSKSIAVLVKPLVSANFTFAPAPSCSLPENVVFTNTSANASGNVWDFGDGATSTDADPVHVYSTNGVYTVKLTTSNACGTDSVVMNQAVQILGGPPVSSCLNICPGEAVNVTASGAGVLSWYDAASQGDLMATGNLYTSPQLDNTITYYVGSVITPPIVAAGPATNAIGGGGNYGYNTAGLAFNSSVPQYLISVGVYASNSGSSNFYIEDEHGNILSSTSATLTVGYQTVPLSLSIPAGNNLSLSSDNDGNLYYNSSGAQYPYISGDGTLQITGNTANTPGAYYYFYDWKLQQLQCSTPLTPVTIYVLGTGGGSFTATGTGSPTVHFMPADTNATTYAWNFGDGDTSTLEYPTHIYPVGGVYTVQLVVSNDTCSDTTTQVVSTVKLGVSALTGVSDLSVYPNPSRDVITVSLSSPVEMSGCRLKITDALGQNVYTNTANVISGANQFSIDIASLDAGIYFVSLQSGRDMATTRFVKTAQ